MSDQKAIDMIGGPLDESRDPARLIHSDPEAICPNQQAPLTILSRLTYFE